MERESKILWGIGIVTIAIIGFGAYFLSKPPKTESEISDNKVDSKLLVKADSNIKKASSEKAILVEFGDFQCPACASYAPVVDQVLESFKDELTFVARHFPLSQHKNALPSAYASEAAGKQGKFWEMYSLLYKNQNDWESSSKPMEIFETYAKDLSLDLEKFRQDVNLKEIKDKVQSDYSDGAVLGVNSTPTFYLNGSKLKAPRSVDEFKSLIRSAIDSSTIKSDTESDEAFHAHFDLLVSIDGKAVDFSQSKYQSTKENHLNEWVHLHDGNGEVVHLHKAEIKLAEFFSSLKMNLNKDCITLDTGTRNCTGESRSLRMFVNGQENKEFENYQPKDLDRVLITYGSNAEESINKQIKNVTDKACIYSETCPERGKPPTEECVGGLGTGCEEEL